MQIFEGALEHRSRKLIFNFISSNPGVSFGAIRGFLDINESTLKYHLNYLEKNNRIYSKHQGRQRCYYSKQRNITEIYTSTNERPSLTNLTETQKLLVNLILKNPGINQKKLRKITKLNKKSISYNIKRLGEQKIIWVVKCDGKVGYEYVTHDKLREEMLNQLVLKLLYNEIDEQTYHKIMKKLKNMDVEELMK